MRLRPQSPGLRGPSRRHLGDSPILMDRLSASLLVAVPVALISVTGCSNGSDPGPSYTVTDSAGIEVVHSKRPFWTAETAWRVNPEPRLEIGRVSGEDAYILDRVMGVTVLDGGGVAIAHMGDNTIRFYDDEGTFVRKVGGQGDGPREFRQILGLQRHGNELWGLQFGGLPAKVFDQSGAFLRAERPDLPVDHRADLRGVFGDGSLLMGDWPQESEPTSQPRIGMSTLVRAAVDRLDTVAVVPAVRILPSPGGPFGMYQELGPRLTLAVAGDHFHHSFPEHYEIVSRDTTGAIRRIIRRDWEPARVTEAHVAWYARAWLDAPMEGGGELPPRVVEQIRARIDAQVHPEHHPAFERLAVSRSGHLWTMRPNPDHPLARSGWHMLRDTPTTWDVFDPDGVWLGPIDLPPRFHAYEFGEDYVAGVWKDEMDIELVRLYALDRGGG